MKQLIKLALLFFCSVSLAQTNLLDTSTWTAGTGSVSGFNKYGDDNVNVREQAIGPHGTSVLLWKRASGISSSSAGGWTTDYVSIDATKTYRFTVWAKKSNSQDGRFYFATDARDVSDNYVTDYLNGGSSNHPYFKVGDLPTLDEWYLLVGFIHHNGYTGTTHLGGIYDTSGAKVANTADFKFQSGAIKTRHKMYFYDQTNINDHGYLYDPTIYEVNGQEPTIQELIDGPPDTQAPTASILSSTGQTDTTVDLSWTAATDDTGVTGYKVFKDGVLEATLGNVLTYQITGLTAATAYNFTVKALDAAGNESADSNVLTITTNSSSGSSYTTEYQAILDEATAQGYTLPSVADQDLQNQIIVSAKASGIWAKSDLILYFKGSGDKNFKLINWKNPTGVKATEESFGGALTWSSTGVKGDGVNLINTHFNPSVGGLNYIQNNAGAYVKVSQAHTSRHGIFGGSNMSLNLIFSRPRINGDGLAPVFTFSGTGLFGLSRNNATSYIVSVDTALTTLTHNSGNIENEELKLLGNGNAPGDYTRFDGEVAYTIVGGDMSDKVSDIQSAFDSTSSGDTQAPTASTLSSTGQTDTTADLSWTAATDNVGVTGYKVFKDGVLEATLGNVLTYQVTGLTANTAYNFTVKAIDAANNESVASNTLSITTDAATDTQAPTASTLSSTGQTETTVDLSWTAATDNVGVTGYKVFKDGVLEATLGNVLTYQVTGLTANTAYNFTVKAIDAANNESVASNTLSITTDAATDTQAPTASTLSSTGQSSSTVDLSWTAATDNVGVTGYKVFKDGVLETTLGNVLTYQVTGLTANTAYNFTVKALDAANNESVASNTLSITTDAATGGGSGNWTLSNQDVYYNTGNVGIGTSTPDEKLAVNGNIHTKEVRVDLDNWPDYVFTKDYKLLSLSQVEKYIKAKGHLPNIPSAEEVAEEGVQLGKMNAKLLEKIEELTLYILQQQKSIETQYKIIEKQSEALKEIQEKLKIK